MKIFNSNESRIKLDFNFEQDYWPLRSTYKYNGFRFFVGFIDDYGYVNYTDVNFNYAILPVCTI